MADRKCRVCDRSDISADEHEDGSSCWWMEDDFCTVCHDRLASLPGRLADCLAEILDTPLLTVRDTLNDWPVELRVGSFNRELAERAAELLEEAGR